MRETHELIYGQDVGAVMWGDGSKVMKSKDDHKRAGMRCFTSVQLRKRMVIE